MKLSDDEVTEELLELLPKRVGELVDVIGLSAALTLVEKFGGRHLWIPKNASADHWLADLLGLEAFGQLCAYAGYSQIEIDSCAALLRAIKNKTILDEFNSGVTNGQIAQKYGMSERNVRMIKQHHKKTTAHPNLDLFKDLLPMGR